MLYEYPRRARRLTTTLKYIELNPQVCITAVRVRWYGDITVRDVSHGKWGGWAAPVLYGSPPHHAMIHSSISISSFHLHRVRLSRVAPQVNWLLYPLEPHVQPSRRLSCHRSRLPRPTIFLTEKHIFNRQPWWPGHVPRWSWQSRQCKLYDSTWRV